MSVASRAATKGVTTWRIAASRSSASSEPPIVYAPYPNKRAGIAVEGAAVAMRQPHRQDRAAVAQRCHRKAWCVGIGLQHQPWRFSMAPGAGKLRCRPQRSLTVGARSPVVPVARRTARSHEDMGTRAPRTVAVAPQPGWIAQSLQIEARPAPALSTFRANGVVRTPAAPPRAQPQRSLALPLEKHPPRQMRPPPAEPQP